MKVVYQAFSTAQLDRALWRLGANRLRILCYHGVCEDAVAREPWAPEFFVTATEFENQLEYLRGAATVIPLREAAARLSKGSLPPRSVSITFDDGYANNLEIARPLLEKHGAPATVFLSSAYMESGEIFPFLKLRHIQRMAREGRISISGEKLAPYKNNPLDVVLRSAERSWALAEPLLSEQQRRTLRPLTVEEVCASRSPLIEFGAHGHTHCILGNEQPARREQEIRVSVRKVRQWTGKHFCLFSYPNGQRGDFGDADKATLRAEAVGAAVSGIAGANSRRSDLFELRRYPVGLYHDGPGFRAEASGFRGLALAVTGRRGA